jgi:hypothetical protein
MTPLISFSDIENLKYIADSVRNSGVWSQFVVEAQMLDVKQWLGDAFLNELMSQKATDPETLTTANLNLLNGGSYVYQTKTYLFQGLKTCIAYYAFGRFTNRMPFNYTAAGIVLKDSDLSTPVSDKVVQRLETEARLTADAIKEETILFLNRNRATYPLWSSSCLVYSTRNRFFKAVGD